jgi:DNA-binding CsgD family transcriptional regulator
VIASGDPAPEWIRHGELFVAGQPMRKGMMEEASHPRHRTLAPPALLDAPSSSRSGPSIAGHGRLRASLQTAQSNAVLDEFFRRYLLSPAERRALIGAIAGLSKHELASEIGCSPRTLETHWTRIFNKVGIRSTEGVLAAVLRCLLWPVSTDSSVRVFPDMTRR